MSAPPMTTVAEVGRVPGTTGDLPAASCSFQTLEPQPPVAAVFQRDCLLHAVSGALHVTVKGEVWLPPPVLRGLGPAGRPLLVDIEKTVTTRSILVRHGFCTLLPSRPTAFHTSVMTVT